MFSSFAWYTSLTMQSLVYMLAIPVSLESNFLWSTYYRM